MKRFTHIILFEDFRTKGRKFADTLGISKRPASGRYGEYGYKIQELFYNYSQPHARHKIKLDELIEELRQIEDDIRSKHNKTDPEEGLWIRFSQDDPGATTIEDIKNQMTRHGNRNRKFMLDQMQMTAELNNEMQINYS